MVVPVPQPPTLRPLSSLSGASSKPANSMRAYFSVPQSCAASLPP
jgi:hypothetical protein